jgi:hypothetical protein
MRDVLGSGCGLFYNTMRGGTAETEKQHRKPGESVEDSIPLYRRRSGDKITIQ